MLKLMESTLNFLRKWWAVVIIPTVALAYTLYNDRLNNREVFEITGMERLALYDLRSDSSVEVPEFVAMLVLEITNRGRTPIFLSRADCLVDWRATRLFHPREVLCAAFAGRPQDDYVGFVRDGLARPTISNFGSMAASAPMELPSGGIGYVTLIFNHNPEPPFPEGQQVRFGSFSTSRWEAEDERRELPFMHEVVFVRSLDAIYDDEQFDSLVGNEIQSYLGADVWLETTMGTRLDPVAIASIVYSDDAAMQIGRSFLLLPNEAAEGN